MSSISLEPIRESRPDLNGVTNRISDWLATRPERTFLDSRAVFRELGSEFPADDIVQFFSALKELELVQTYYRVIDDRGSFVGEKYPTFDDIPEIEETPSGESFNVDRHNIVLVYEFG